MNETAMMSSSHAVYSLRLHIVFVTKYRRQTLTPELLAALREAFAEILADWRCTLTEFGGGKRIMSICWWVSILR